jgi:hypothetical protein
VNDIRITHVGGPTTLIQVGGWRILTDPTFDVLGRTYQFGWGTGLRKIVGTQPVDGGAGRLAVQQPSTATAAARAGRQRTVATL